MRYLSSEPLTLPKPMSQGLNGLVGVNMSLPEIAKTLLETYGPRQDFSLTIQQLRSLNKALDAFEAQPDNGYYLLDDAEYQLIKLVLENMAPKTLVSHARNVPAILDALEASPHKRPLSLSELAVPAGVT